MLFQETQIGEMTMRNRIIRSATAESLADASGRPLPQLAELYRDLARGGVGLIVTGHMYVHPTGKAHPNMTAIDRDGLLPDLGALADVVHEEGARIVAQLNHAGRQTRAGEMEEALAPSAAEAADSKRVPARAASDREIAMLIDAYVQAARRAKLAGFDGVQLHAAHGYLIGQFLSPLANHRNDGWGGSLGGRVRFLESVVRAVRVEVGRHYPLLVKLGIRDESDEGLSLREGVDVARRLESFGVDAIEVSGGIGQSGTFNIRGAIRPGAGEAYFRAWAQTVGAAVEIPVAVVGGVRSLEMAEDLVASGDAKLISLCRPLICEPRLPRMWQRGDSHVSACVSGNRCWPRSGQLGISCKCSGVVRSVP